MDLSKLVSAGALVVSIVSAWTAFQAKEQAAELQDRQFSSDKTLEILGHVYDEVSRQRVDAEGARWSCLFVATLSEAERNALSTAEGLAHRKVLVGPFIERATAMNLWNPDCASRIEGILSDEPAAASSVPPAIEGQQDFAGLSEIGEWHALIASYNISSFGCDQAKRDVEHFAQALAGRGFDGRKIYVVQTAISQNYAVTVDAGGDQALAQGISTAIRQTAPADGTGGDSFVQGNRGWTISPECTVAATIGAVG